LQNILVLEDLEGSFELVKYSLGGQYHISWARSVNEAKNMLNSQLDLLLLDVTLPDGDGYEFCRWAKHSGYDMMPIIFISANSSVEACVTGLAAGGDDYIHKPFHPAELMARVGAKLRSVKFQCDILNILQSNGVKMDLQSHKVSYAGKNEVIELDLTPIEFKILQIFLEKPGVAMDRNYILDRVWGKEVFVYPRSVDTHICKLKKKLKNNSGLISSVHGKGYRFGLDRIAI